MEFVFLISTIKSGSIAAVHLVVAPRAQRHQVGHVVFRHVANVIPAVCVLLRQQVVHLLRQLNRTSLAHPLQLVRVEMRRLKRQDADVGGRRPVPQPHRIREFQKLVGQVQRLAHLQAVHAGPRAVRQLAPINQGILGPVIRHGQMLHAHLS